MDIDALVKTLAGSAPPPLPPTSRVFISVAEGWYEQPQAGLEAWHGWRGGRPVALETAVRGEPTVLELQVGAATPATVVCEQQDGVVTEVRIYVDPEAGSDGNR